MPLPGGDFPVDAFDRLVEDIQVEHPYLSAFHARRLVRAYGTLASEVLDGATSFDDLGQDFGASLTEREVRWLITHEFARCADDILWRRSKLGLRLSAEEIQTLDAWMSGNCSAVLAQAAQ